MRPIFEGVVTFDDANPDDEPGKRNFDTLTPIKADDEFYLHSLLCYSQHVVAAGHCCPLLWDVRESPPSAQRVVSMDSITNHHLSLPATSKPMPILQITCDLFPDDWSIKALRLEGVTIGDVLNAIYTMLRQPIRRNEWDLLSDKQRSRVVAVFEERCKIAPNPDECRSHGILRADCLIHHTLFAGLSVSPVNDCSSILTLRRRPHAPTSNNAIG